MLIPMKSMGDEDKKVYISLCLPFCILLTKVEAQFKHIGTSFIVVAIFEVARSWGMSTQQLACLLQVYFGHTRPDNDASNEKGFANILSFVSNVPEIKSDSYMRLWDPHEEPLRTCKIAYWGSTVVPNTDQWKALLVMPDLQVHQEYVKFFTRLFIPKSSIRPLTLAQNDVLISTKTQNVLLHWNHAVMPVYLGYIRMTRLHLEIMSKNCHSLVRL